MLLSIKRICRPDYFLVLYSGILVTILASSCNTRIQGCLEINAENFNLDAERSCDDCCTYPSMALTMTQKWGDENFTNLDTFFDISGNAYQISDLRYFLTSWSWKDPSGERYTVDSVSAACHSSILNYTPDVLVIDTRRFAYSLGTIRQAPLMESVQLSLGLVEDFSCLDSEDPQTPSDLTDQSPLWNPQTSMLETIRLIVRTNLDADLMDTIFINTRRDIFIPYSEQMALGIDFSMGLTVDYALWFQEVDVNNLSSFSHSILSHFEGSIYRTP